MTDQFGREINYARISVTDRCNLRCRYCMPTDGVEKIPHAEILSFEEILRVAELLSRLGVKKIRLTGGEPLLRKNLPTLIRELKKISGIEKVTMTTNGVLLKNFARELRAAGLDGVNLSLDALDEKIFADLTRRKFYSQVRDGLETLLAENFSDVKINCVPLRGVNENQIVKLATLAKNFPVKVRFIELMPIGCATNSELVGVRTEKIITLLKKSFGEFISVREEKILQGPAKYFQPKSFFGQLGFIDALAHKFCGECNRVRLTAEGFLKTCLAFDSGVDVKKFLRSGASDEEIFAAIERAIYLKPREHFFLDGAARDSRQMYQVGG